MIKVVESVRTSVEGFNADTTRESKILQSRTGRLFAVPASNDDSAQFVFNVNSNCKFFLGKGTRIKKIISGDIIVLEIENGTNTDTEGAILCRDKNNNIRFLSSDGASEKITAEEIDKGMNIDKEKEIIEMFGALTMNYVVENDIYSFCEQEWFGLDELGTATE